VVEWVDWAAAPAWARGAGRVRPASSAVEAARGVARGLQLPPRGSTLSAPRDAASAGDGELLYSGAGRAELPRGGTGAAPEAAHAPRAGSVGSGAAAQRESGAVAQREPSGAVRGVVEARGARAHVGDFGAGAGAGAGARSVGSAELAGAGAAGAGAAGAGDRPREVHFQLGDAARGGAREPRDVEEAGAREGGGGAGPRLAGRGPTDPDARAAPRASAGGGAGAARARSPRARSPALSPRLEAELAAERLSRSGAVIGGIVDRSRRAAVS